MATPTKPLHIGVLINNLDGYFERELLDGLRIKAQAEGLKLLYIAGHNVNASDLFRRQFNVTYDLGNCPQIDAIVSATAFFQTEMSLDEGIAFINRYRPRPTINLNFTMPGCPSINIDNRTGFRDLMHHLIHVHGYKRLAFMKGSDGNLDGAERFSVYKECLAEAGFEFDPLLVVNGDFNQFDGRIAMAKLLDRKRPFDVLVAASDKMAQVAMAVAIERGFRIPHDFALTGFDDLLYLSKEGPSLTTINQSLRHQMAVAIDVLLAIARGEQVPHVTTLPTRLVLRQSCGCGAKIQLTPLQADSEPLQVHDAIIALVALLPEQTRQFRRYLQQLEQALHLGNDQFEDRLSRMAQECLAQSGDISQLQALLLAMYRHLDALPGVTPDKRQRYGEYLQNGQIVLFNVHSIFNLRETVTEDYNDFMTRQLGFLKKRMSNLDHDTLMNLIEEVLHEFGIPSCYIALYDAPFIFSTLANIKLPETSRLIFAMTDYVRHAEDIDQPFATRNLVPDQLFSKVDHQVMGLFPLFQYAEHYGYIILDLTVMPATRLELIRDEISTNIINSVLVAELAQARDLLKMDLAIAEGQNERLEHLAVRDELTGQYNRRGFFNLAVQQIEAGNGFPMMIIFADLDGLKIINDNFGHIEGDFSIRKASQLLAQVFRTSDIICRLGGDEFVILSPECTPDDLLSIKRRVYERFNTFNAESDKPYKIACSIGYFVLTEDDKTPLELILNRADQYLYEEKRRRKSGRDTT
ncbi:MAG: GGDEF domain-containing protein [Pseudomonadota bacterium]